MSPDLELINLGKVYDNGTTAVSAFNLTVNKGEFIAFLGPSGCGKTTTLRMIAGFETISSGDMLIRGQRMNEVPPAKRPTATIFQNYALFPHMTVRRNVGYGLEVKGLAKREREAKVERIMASFGLEDIAERRPATLSGGQRQRVALARGLVIEPDILLLDEPLGALDANLRKAIQNEIKILQKTLGVTFIFVTHAQSEALALSDRIVVMNRGRVEQISPPERLYTRPNTPFVAQFIGRNAIFDGTVSALTDEGAALDTPAGQLNGQINGSLTAGQAARLVVPTEAITINRDPAGQPLASTVQANHVPGRISRLAMVGHLLHLGVTLADGRALTLEAHGDKYQGAGLSSGDPVTLWWNAADATVIPAA